MYRNGYRLVLVSMIAILAMSTVAFAATPSPTSAVIKARVFNDCPITTLTETNNYPSSIVLNDVGLGCAGFANLHNWRLSEDGSTPAEFGNFSAWSLSFDLMITGTSNGEAGLSVAPWWSPDVDGRFNVRTTDGEIACFGGRLPFYSFTGSHGINYVKGDVISLMVTYLANSITEANPATIEYVVRYNGGTYSSGPLPFDMGNPAEDPPYGLWGMLNQAQVGGYVQEFMVNGDFGADLRTEWSNIVYENLHTVSTEDTSWGAIKAQY